MRERNLKPMERNWTKDIHVVKEEDVKNIKQVLNIVDHLIAGRRFGELDSAKQMYLLDCQAKITDMQEGRFTDDSLEFLRELLDSLIKIFIEAKGEIDKVLEK